MKRKIESTCFICGKSFEEEVPLFSFSANLPPVPKTCPFHRAVIANGFCIIIEAKPGTTEPLGHWLYVRKNIWDSLFTGEPPKVRVCFVDSVTMDRLSRAMDRASNILF